jgi:phage replication O-like protein O
MASPQKENGYAGIANEILEQLSRRKFNGTQNSILYCLFRYTYGFNRKSHEMSLSFIETATGIKKKRLSPALTSLIDANVITVYQAHDTSHTSREIGFNKNYEEWDIELWNPEQSPQKGTVPQKRNSPQKEEQSSKKGTVEKPHKDGLSTQSPESGTVPKKGNQENNIYKASKELENKTATISLYGEYDNVKISVETYDELCNEFSEEELMHNIERLSKFIYFENAHVKDHAATMRKWMNEDRQTLSPKKPNSKKSFEPKRTYPNAAEMITPEDLKDDEGEDDENAKWL